MKTWIGITLTLSGCLSGDERVSLGEDADGDADMDADGGRDCNYSSGPASGPCEPFRGWYWDGDSCESGCCSGVDCSPGYDTIYQCAADCPAEGTDGGGETCDDWCVWYDGECVVGTGTCLQNCTPGSCLETCLEGQGGCGCTAQCGL